MNSEILDDEFITKGEKEQSKIVKWLSIMILWAGIGFCGSNGLLGELKVIVAIVLLTLSTVVTYFNYELGVKITFWVILIGMINLIDFFPVKYLISFGLNTIEIGFEFLLFGIGIIHYSTHKREISKFLRKLVAREISEEEIRSAQRSRINGFKGRFSNKPTSELEVIANNDRLVPEAVKAAEELIQERNTN